jgi:hypothetical protein
MRTRSLVFALFLSMIPSVAVAQTTEEGESFLGGALSTTLLFIFSPLTTTGGIISSTTGLFSSVLGQLDHYIRENAVALQQDLRVGGGHSVDDLAQMFGVPEERRAAFAYGLRRHDDELVSLTRIEGANMERTRRFAFIVIDVMTADAVMAPIAHRLVNS